MRLAHKGRSMARPKKCRKVCCLPKNHVFAPIANSIGESMESSERVELAIEEYETLRLIDEMNFTQEECASFMEVSRTTVQSLYENARKKVARFLVRGGVLEIKGGDYSLCDGKEEICYCGGCKKHRDGYKNLIKNNCKKGENVMKIAVTYCNGEIFQHFGRTEQFKVYSIENGKIVNSEIIDTQGSGHSALAGILINNGIDVLICGGIGGGAQNALAQANVKFYGGASGNADKNVEDFLSNTLSYTENVQCSHHESHHHGEHHVCGENGCGSHRCGSH